MDLTPNKYDAIILKIAVISPTTRDVLEGETYRLRLETDDVDSEAVLQECIIALRDDLAAIGLYLKGPLSDLYTNFTVLNTVIDTLGYLFPNTLYPKIREIAEFRPAIQNILQGGIGEESTLILYLNWLGRNENCFDPSCKAGADWIAEFIHATPVFDIYLKNIIDVESTLDHPVVVSPDDHIQYIDVISEKAYRMYDALSRLTPVIPDDVVSKLHRRVMLYVRSLTQAQDHAERVWLFTTDSNNLSDDLQTIYKQRLAEFQKSQKLYGGYYAENLGIELTPFILLGIAVRLWSDKAEWNRREYAEALLGELTLTRPDTPLRAMTVILHSLIVQIVSTLFPTSKTVEALADV